MKPMTEDQLLYEHDIKLQQLEARLNSLENLVNAIHNHIPVWWDKQKPE